MEKLVPKDYHKYLKVFSKEELERMPIKKPWDHTIELKTFFNQRKADWFPFQ